MHPHILPMFPEHWPAVRDIYREGIETGNATFETVVPPWEKWDDSHHQHSRLIAVEQTSAKSDNRTNASVLGWAALSPVSTRYVYRGVAEVSVYVAASARGRGIGKALLSVLITESEKNGIWTLQAGIFPENMASITLHKSFGFREIGLRQRIGKLANRWRDVALLEHRSSLVGI